MDPKMDTGYLTGEDTLEDDYDVLRELLPEEVLGIMDQMLCFEVCLFRDMYSRWTSSDTDHRYRRWHGIWAIPSRKLSLPLCTSIDSCGQNQRLWSKLALKGMEARTEM